MSKYIKPFKASLLSGVFATIAITLLSTSAFADNNSKTKYGITVTTCSFDYDEEDFCADGRMKAFAKVMKERPANFAGDRVLYLYKPSYSYRMVSIDKNKKTVTPFYWGFSEAEQSVNSKGEKLEFDFSKTSNEFCYKGDISAYRNAYSYDLEYYPKFCFDYDKTKNAFGWFKQ